jgi:ectoine hydroxylase-related dioxygenase (phytanoyl-CoA dioxygenase family)
MLKTVSACASREQIAAILDEDGCVIIENPVETRIVDRIAGDLDLIFDKAQFARGVFVGNNTKRLGSILKKSGVSLHMLTNQHVLDAMGHMLLPNCERFQLNLTQAVSIHPRERAQILHRDDELFPCRDFTGEMMANAIWALTDFYTANGGTQLVIGSHKWSRDRQPEPHEITQAEMKKGSVLIYRGSLLHGGGANHTMTPRVGLIFSYNLGWLRQGENQYLAYPPEVAKFLPATAQELIGYAIHRPNLGQHECADPQRMLKPRYDPDRLVAYDFLTPEQEQRAASYAA